MNFQDKWSAVLSSDSLVWAAIFDVVVPLSGLGVWFDGLGVWLDCLGVCVLLGVIGEWLFLLVMLYFFFFSCFLGEPSRDILSFKTVKFVVIMVLSFSVSSSILRLWMMSEQLDISFLTTLACLPEDITFRIFTFCGLQEILAMDTACWLTRTLVWCYIRRVWSFDLRFKLWFSDVRSFQRMLCRCRAIVSGSLALQFFHRVHYPNSDMDIYVHHAGIKVVTNWIAGEGYVLSSGRGGSDVMPPHIQDVSMDVYHANSTFITAIMNYDKHEVHWNGTIRRRRVQVIGVSVHPLQHILHEYHSSRFIPLCVCKYVC